MVLVDLFIEREVENVIVAQVLPRAIGNRNWRRNAFPTIPGVTHLQPFAATRFVNLAPRDDPIVVALDIDDAEKLAPGAILAPI